MIHHSFTQVFLHFVWTTKDRAPLLTEEIRDDVYRLILAKAQELDTLPLALNGMDDHVHLLVTFPATLTQAHFMNSIKGTTSHAINERFHEQRLRWQEGYGVFSVSKHMVPRVQGYIVHQQRHHEHQSTEDEFQSYHEITQQQPAPSPGLWRPPHMKPEQ